MKRQHNFQNIYYIVVMFLSLSVTAMIVQFNPPTLLYIMFGGIIPCAMMLLLSLNIKYYKELEEEVMLFIDERFGAGYFDDLNYSFDDYYQVYCDVVAQDYENKLLEQEVLASIDEDDTPNFYDDYSEYLYDTPISFKLYPIDSILDEPSKDNNYYQRYVDKFSLTGLQATYEDVTASKHFNAWYTRQSLIDDELLPF